MKFLRKLIGLDIDPYPNVPKNMVNTLFIKKVGPTNSGHNGIFFHFPKFPSTNNSLMEVNNEFEQSLIVQPNAIDEYQGALTTLYGTMWISVSIVLNNKVPRFLFVNHSKDFKPKTGDSISFLFGNGSIKKYTFESDSFKFDTDQGIRLSNEFSIEDEDLILFAENRITKWQFLSEKTNNTIISEVDQNTTNRVLINAKMISIYLEEM